MRSCCVDDGCYRPVYDASFCELTPRRTQAVTQRENETGGRELHPGDLDMVDWLCTSSSERQHSTCYCVQCQCRIQTTLTSLPMHRQCSKISEARPLWCSSGDISLTIRTIFSTLCEEQFASRIPAMILYT